VEDRRALDVGLRPKDVDSRIAFALEVGPDVPQIGDLPPDHGRTDDARPAPVAEQADLGRQGEDDGHGWPLGPPSEVEWGGPSEALEVGRIHDGQETGLKSVPDRHAEEFKRRIGDSLVRLVPGEQPSETVRGNDRLVREVPLGERRLPRSGGTDQKDQGIRRHADRAPSGQDRVSHRWMIPRRAEQRNWWS